MFRKYSQQGDKQLFNNRIYFEGGQQTLIFIWSDYTPFSILDQNN